MYLRFKRCLDIILSLSAIVAFCWLLLIIAILIKLEDGGNVIFKQKRIGRCNKEFYIFKFRTMKIDTPKDIPTHLLEEPDKYITSIGKFLRKSSLDELPQLFNILYGQMSIIGPRPALWNQYDLIDARNKNGSSSLAPGLTGWAQVNGRDELPIDVKARYDGEYLNRVSLAFDIKILFMTIVSVFKADGISEGSNEDINNRRK